MRCIRSSVVVAGTLGWCWLQHGETQSTLRKQPGQDSGGPALSRDGSGEVQDSWGIRGLGYLGHTRFQIPGAHKVWDFQGT